MLMKWSKEDLKYKSDTVFSLISWIVLNRLEDSKLRCQFSADWSIDLMQSQLDFFVVVNKKKLILTFIWKGKWTRLAKTSFKRKNKVEGLILPIFTTSYKTTIIKMCVTGEGIHIAQWDRTESSEKDAHKYGQLIFLPK